LAHLGIHEATFYENVSNLKIELPIPACFNVEYSLETQQSQLLMRDLSVTHYQKPLPLPPSIKHCQMIAENLARIHAAWWKNPQLGQKIGKRLELEAAKEMEQRLFDTLPAFFNFLDGALLPHQKKAIETILSSDFLARLSKRLHELQGVTIIHGDAHSGNILLPKNDDKHTVKFIDWQLWDINVGARDLAFFMGLHWSPHRRTILEKKLLQHYYTNLLELGVQEYTWEDLWCDYREAVIVMPLIPIGQFRRNSPPGVIWHGLQNSLAAFEDLKCSELL